MPYLAPSSDAPTGLEPYDVDDAEFFFGRAAEVADCLADASAGVLASSAPRAAASRRWCGPGSGASAAAGGRWRGPATGATPKENSWPRVGRASEVLVVDQAEELFTLLATPAQRARSPPSSRRATPAPRPVRADHFGDLAALPGFARLVESAS